MTQVKFAVGNVSFAYSLSEEQKKFSYLTEETTIDLDTWPEFTMQLTEAIQSAIPDALKLPTEKQLAYVQIIAKDLKVALPEGYQDSALVCLSFFAEYKPKHDQVLAVYRGVKSKLLT
ncbi:hypothetical protein HQQ94_21860 [Shewanella sp. VB17]|uniref:hypothetical protein n=1 Tax=Shewanella sp. VB17 TaxID=2739432 RepID=UPI00156448E4|nr:hypothetical protein [Shewanella sp. VB17]NRD75813.1 hypothetical protein [Shewanella sp. VB17]